jgi:hypothetical protein
MAATEKLKVLRYFPSESADVVMELLEKMVPTVAALDWLVDAMVSRVGEWQGPVELRGVLCQRCSPLDGIEAFCTKGYYSMENVETRSINEAEDLKSLPLPDLKQLTDGEK